MSYFLRNRCAVLPRQTLRNKTAGFTLIELVVALGLFAIVMTIASGAYLTMIGLNRQAQGVATGIDTLSFALNTMARSIRTGTGYCGGASTCPSTDSFFFTNDRSEKVAYSLSGNTIYETINGGAPVALTDPAVTVTSLKFYPTGTAPYSSGQNILQAHVTIIVAGYVSIGHGKKETFSVETGATMRGTDL